MEAFILKGVLHFRFEVARRYSPFLPKNWGRYPGVVLARQRAKRRGAQVGRGKRHFQHSLTVEKALCEPGGAWRAGGA